jgi:hypothetical protein
MSSWFSDLFSDADFMSGLMTAGASLAGGLVSNDVTSQNLEIERELAQQKLEQDRELTLAQIAASQANAGIAAETAKEVAKKQIAAKLAAQYGEGVSRSSLARAEALKNKDVEIPQSIGSLFGRIQGGLK